MTSDPQYKHTKNYYSEAEYQNTDVRNSEAEGNIPSRRSVGLLSKAVTCVLVCYLQAQEYTKLFS